MNRPHLQRIRWAQAVELLELHRDLTDRRKAMTSNYTDATRELATVEFQMDEVEEHLRKLRT